MGREFMTITMPGREFEENLAKVRTAENAADVLKNVWRVLFLIDLADPSIEEGQIKPWDYKMSQELAEELMDYSIEKLEADMEGVTLLWLNWSPAMCKDLERNQIASRYHNHNHNTQQK